MINELSRIGLKDNIVSKWITLIVLLSITFMVDPTYSQESPGDKYRVCGERLVKALSVVCRGCFLGGFSERPVDSGKSISVSLFFNKFYVKFLQEV